MFKISANRNARRHTFLLIAVALLTILAMQSAYAAKFKILPAPKKLSDHVYAWIGPLEGPSKDNNGYRMNLVFVVGKNAVAVFDTGYTRAMAKEMINYIRDVTNLPIKYAVNTSSQPHRYMGNDVFRSAGAKIIAHKNSAIRMESMGNNFATFIERLLEAPKGSITTPKQPDVLIADSYKIDLGGISLDVQHVGPAHTPAQLIVKIDKDKMIYTGDLLYDGRLLAVLSDSKVGNWIKAYDDLKKEKGYTLIPGHGEPGPLSNFDFPTRSYLSLLFNHMNKMVEDGADVQDAINKLDQSKYSKLVNYEQLAGRNASWTYLEREAASFE